mgnify:CR=1 FL=1
MQFLSDEWAEAYASLLNNDAIIAKKLKRFSTLIKYRIRDRGDDASLVIKIEKGVCTSFGSESVFNPKDIEYDIWADASSWQGILDKSTTLSKEMDKHNFGFKGPKLKALTNKSGLEHSLNLMLGMKNIRV